MKRKKWTEEEESTLLSEYSSLRSSGALARLRTREKKFQPIADRVNAAHHLLDPSSFPFLWSWRDVSVKIQNMRHQFVNVKLKIQSSPSSFDWDHGLQLWPNLLRYRDVFGDIDLENPSTVPSDGDEIEVDADGKGSEGRSVKKGKRKWRKVRIVAARVAEIAVRRREREAAAEDEEEERRLRRLEDREEEERERRRRRWREEERREEEEMEWREKLLGMQMEHEKQVMQMHADACQAQMQVLGILVRVVCQILGPGGGGGDGGGITGMTSQVLHGLQQTQQSPDSLVGDADGKDAAHSAAHYL